MNIDAIEYLIGELEKIETKIKHLESSPNRAFILIESDTLKLFHWFNLCFKHFWKEEFDRNSANHLLQYQDIVKTYSDLSDRYTSLFQEQIDYLRDVLTIDKKTSKDLNPVFFGEEKNIDIIDYYEEQLKYELDIKGEPLYKVDVCKDIYYEDIEKKSPSFDFYIFRSDSINNTHFRGLLGLYYCLKSIFKLMCVICSYPEELVSGYKPNQEEIIRSLELELRHYTREVGKNVERDLKKTAQELKNSRSSHLTPDVWGNVMKKEDELYDSVINGREVEIEKMRFENISATKEQLMDNYSLLQKIKTTCLDGELFDIRLSVETHNLLSSLNADNLDLFYELVLRRNIIQREMFPEEMISMYEEWLNPSGNEDTQNQNESQKEINYFAPQKILQEMLKQDCFNEVRKDQKYDEKWTDAFVEDLMKSEYGKTIAEDWALKGSRNKRNQIKGYVFGVLKDAGVLKGGYDTIAAKVVGKGEARTFGKYMGEGKNQPYAEWVKDYVSDVKE